MARARSKRRIALLLTGAAVGLAVVLIGIGFAVFKAAMKDPFIALFDEHCSVCHGETLEGTISASP